MPKADDCSEVNEPQEGDKTTPDWLRATVEDVGLVDINAPLKGQQSADYRALSTLYREEAEVSKVAAKKTEFFVYIFVAAVLSMFMKEESPNEPFTSMIVMPEAGRSAAGKDFVGKAEVLSSIADHSTHPLIRARCADLAWLLQRRMARLAQVAIDSYVQAAQLAASGGVMFSFGSEKGSFHPDVKKWLARALQISRGARKQGVIISSLHDVVRSMLIRAIEEKFHVGVLWYARLCLDFELKEYEVLGRDVENALRSLQPNLGPQFEAQIWKLVAECFHYANLKDDQYRCIVEAAEVLVRQAMDTPQSAMVKAHILSDAVSQLQGIPGHKERRNEIKALLVDVQATVNDEMSIISHEIDLGEPIEAIKEHFESIELIDQIFDFALIDRPRSIIVLREEAMRQIADHPMTYLFQTTIIDKHGKVIEKASSDKIGDPSEDTIKHVICNNEGLRRQLVVAGQIEIARRIIVQNSYLDENFLVPLIGGSPFIPSDLRRTYVYGLTRFLQGDFVAATYVLTPLLEAMVRHLLKQSGVDVSKFMDSTETQEDYTISGLFVSFRQQLNEILTQSYVECIDNIFLSKFGPHVRHTVSHGLMNDDGPFGTDTIYGCWLIFRLCMLPLLPYRDQVKAHFERAYKGEHRAS